MGLNRYSSFRGLRYLLYPNNQVKPTYCYMNALALLLGLLNLRRFEKTRWKSKKIIFYNFTAKIIILLLIYNSLLLFFIAHCANPKNKLDFHFAYRFDFQLLYCFDEAFQCFIVHRIYFQNKGYFGRGCILGKSVYSANFFHKVMVQDFGYF